jgi:predicted enzyme related to lactoylglutathione lyase
MELSHSMNSGKGESAMSNTITWFELPAVDFDRAVEFYHTVLGADIRRVMDGERPNGIFSTASRADVTGALVTGEGYVPSATGPVVYFSVGTPENLDQVLARVEQAGGKVLQPRTDIGEPGFIAMIRDSEGNRVGLHASPHR